MGGKSSKRSAPSRYSSFGSSTNSWSHHEYQQSSYPQPTHTYAPPHPPQSYGGWGPDSKKKLERKYSRIDDNYNSLDQVKLLLYYLCKSKYNIYCILVRRRNFCNPQFQCQIIVLARVFSPKNLVHAKENILPF